jgi:thiamine-monophosphate kinase
MPPEIAIPPGDDCAALRVAPDRLLLFTVDQVIGDRHYVAGGPAATSPELVGRKLLARNLSDIAAMGGSPLYALVAAALGPEQDQAWLDRFFAGLLELASQWATVVVGGDLARAPHDAVASLTLVGTVAPDHVCRRTGAQPEDCLYATGRFGDSLRTGHHLTFAPRLREGQWLATQGFAKAMIDVSDGLLLDSLRICRASAVALRLDVATVPLRTAQTTAHGALTDGEDYELLFAVAAGNAGRLERDWPFPDTPLTRVGEFQVGEPVVLDTHGHPLDLGMGGFDHFRRTTFTRGESKIVDDLHRNSEP